MNADDTAGDKLARLFAKSENLPELRRLLTQLTDLKQREIIMEAVFDSLDVVDKLAWLSEHKIPLRILEKVGDGES